LFPEVPEFLWVDAELGKRFEEEPDCLEEPIVPVMDGGLGLSGTSCHSNPVSK
jgi:hypothetical protein